MARSDEYANSRLHDKLMAILFIFLIPLILLFVGASINKLYLVGISYIIYGLYGLVFRRIWIPLPMDSQISETMTKKELKNLKRNYFRFKKEAIPVALMFIYMGLVLALMFYLCT